PRQNTTEQNRPKARLHTDPSNLTRRVVAHYGVWLTGQPAAQRDFRDPARFRSGVAALRADHPAGCGVRRNLAAITTCFQGARPIKSAQTLLDALGRRRIATRAVGPLWPCRAQVGHLLPPAASLDPP